MTEHHTPHRAAEWDFPPGTLINVRSKERGARFAREAERPLPPQPRHYPPPLPINHPAITPPITHRSQRLHCVALWHRDGDRLYLVRLDGTHTYDGPRLLATWVTGNYELTVGSISYLNPRGRKFAGWSLEFDHGTVQTTVYERGPPIRQRLISAWRRLAGRDDPQDGRCAREQPAAKAAARDAEPPYFLTKEFEAMKQVTEKTERHADRPRFKVAG